MEEPLGGEVAVENVGYAVSQHLAGNMGQLEGKADEVNRLRTKGTVLTSRASDREKEVEIKNVLTFLGSETEVSVSYLSFPGTILFFNPIEISFL